MVIAAHLGSAGAFRRILLAGRGLVVLVSAGGQLGVRGELPLVQRRSGASAGPFPAVVALPVQDLLGLLQLAVVGLVVVGVLDRLPCQPQSIQKIRVIIGMPADGDGRPEHSLLDAAGQSAVFLLIPADGLLAHAEDAVAWDDGAADGVGEHRPLCVHIQPVGEHDENELPVISPGHVVVVGDTVAEVQAVKGLIDIYIRCDQPLVFVQKAQTGPAVGVERIGHVDLPAPLAHIVAGEGGIDGVLILDLYQRNRGTAAAGQRLRDAGGCRHGKPVLVHNAKHFACAQHRCRNTAHYCNQSNKQLLHGKGSSLSPDIRSPSSLKRDRLLPAPGRNNDFPDPSVYFLVCAACLRSF